jgi:hypothetical protein
MDRKISAFLRKIDRFEQEKSRRIAFRPVICRCLISAPGMLPRVFQSSQVYQTSVSLAFAMCEKQRALTKVRTPWA